MQNFYIVINAEQSPMTATARHRSFSAARAEAERLCQKTGKRFIVLQAIGAIEPTVIPTRWVDADKAEDERPITQYVIAEDQNA
jgi:hypothetical protein